MTTGKTERGDKIVAYMTAAELENIRTAAAYEGLSLSAYVRRLALDHTARRIATIRTSSGALLSPAQAAQDSAS